MTDDNDFETFGDFVLKSFKPGLVVVQSQSHDDAENFIRAMNREGHRKSIKDLNDLGYKFLVLGGDLNAVTKEEAIEWLETIKHASGDSNG